MIIIRKHDKREAPSMTPSKETIEYFKDINIVCVATTPSDSKKQSPEVSYCHDQRFCLMDEPISNDVEKVDFKQNFSLASCGMFIICNNIIVTKFSIILHLGVRSIFPKTKSSGYISWDRA